MSLTKHWEYTNCQEEIRHSHAAIIVRSPLEHNEMWMYYISILLPSIKYPLPSINLTQPDCISIEKTYKPTILQKCSYNRNTHKGSGELQEHIIQRHQHTKPLL